MEQLTQTKEEAEEKFEFTPKTYRMSRATCAEVSYCATIPAAIMRHEAGIRGLSVKEFVKQYDLLIKYVDDSPSFMIYEFRKIGGEPSLMETLGRAMREGPLKDSKESIR